MAFNLTPPEPIRTDASNAFANNTMKVRIPDIIAETRDRNPDYPDRIKDKLTQLQARVASGERIPPLENKTAFDYESWLTALEQQQVMVDDALTWHNAQWFFAETYVYRYLMQVVRWYETWRDPFLPKKIEELEGDALWTLLDRALDQSGTVAEQFLNLVAFGLWGNRIDLSYAASMAHGTHTTDDDLLVDDRSRLLAHLQDTASGTDGLKGDGAVYIIADNAGSELAMDLVLTDFMLSHLTDRVYLHVKIHPTFVSDVIPADIWMMLDAMRAKDEKAHALAERLYGAWVDERLVIVPHPFWNSSYFMWDMPTALHELMDRARLVIIKGDANYRRAVGDSVWKADTPFADVMHYLHAPALCLRTLKSDPIVGLPSAQMAHQLDNIDPLWRSNGKRGVIQFKP